MGTYLGEAFRLEIGVETGVFRAVCFLLGLGLAGGTRVEPYSVGRSPASLTGELSVEEPVSSINISSYSEGLADAGNFEVLLEASRKDFLEGLAMDFGIENFGCEGEVDDLACLANKLRTSGRSIRLVGVLKRLFQ